jgi:hypothetical protein
VEGFWVCFFMGSVVEVTHEDLVPLFLVTLPLQTRGKLSDLVVFRRTLVSWPRFVIPGVVGSQRPKFLGHIFPLGCSSSPQNFVSRLQVVWEIHRSKVQGCFAGWFLKGAGTTDPVQVVPITWFLAV